VVLRARPDVGAVTLALLFGLFNLICGTWMLAGGIELRQTGQTLRPVLSPGSKERGLAGAEASMLIGKSRRWLLAVAVFPWCRPTGTAA